MGYNGDSSTPFVSAEGKEPDSDDSAAKLLKLAGLGLQYCTVILFSFIGQEYSCMCSTGEGSSFQFLVAIDRRVHLGHVITIPHPQDIVDLFELRPIDKF